MDGSAGGGGIRGVGCGGGASDIDVAREVFDYKLNIKHTHGFPFFCLVVISVYVNLKDSCDE